MWTCVLGMFQTCGKGTLTLSWQKLAVLGPCFPVEPECHLASKRFGKQFLGRAAPGIVDRQVFASDGIPVGKSRTALPRPEVCLS